MNKHAQLSALLALVLVVNHTTPAVAGNPRPSMEWFDGQEHRLLADAADGCLDRFSLFDAALIASRLPDAKIAATCHARFDEFCISLAREMTARASVRRRAEQVFRRMHQKLLTGQYQAACTELHSTLEEGHFNCVTATILYRCLCAKFAIPLKTIAQTGHVYCRLAGDEPVAIQTTSPDGFAASETTGGGREISDVQLLAKIYYNRGVSLLEDHRFQQALDLLRLGSRLDPQDRIAWRNLLACINNWALSECDAGRFRQAAELLSRGLHRAPDYQPFLDNELYVYHRWVSRLCAQGRFRQALDVLDSGYQRRPDAPLFDSGRLAVYRAWENALVASGKRHEAAAVLAAARNLFPKRVQSHEAKPGG